MALADRMVHHRVPGLSVALIDGGAISWAKGYGTRQAGRDLLWSPEDRKPSASNLQDFVLMRPVLVGDFLGGLALNMVVADLSYFSPI